MLSRTVKPLPQSLSTHQYEFAHGEKTFTDLQRAVHMLIDFGAKPE